jgi:hypothetical protein
MNVAPIDQFKSDLAALEACVARAGQALGCCYAGSDEFEAEVVRMRRANGAFDRPHLVRMRFILGATVATSLAALLLLVL